MGARTVVSRQMRHARWGTTVVFAAHGTVTGSFAARVPWVAAHVHVSVGELSVALLMPGVGAMVAMPFSGRMVHRYPAGALMALLVAIWSFSLVLPSLPTSLPVLCLALLPFGAAGGVTDNAMNSHAVLVEAAYGRSVMSSFHGAWSVGALIGSGVAALCTRSGVAPPVEFLLTAACLAVIGGAACRYFVPGAPPVGTEEPPIFALPTKPVLFMGIVGLCAVFGEQTGSDWSALYIHKDLGGSLSVAALAVSAFALAMAVTRLLGDHAIRRFGPVKTVRAAGVGAGAGAVLVALAHQVPLALAGFALLGVGVAVVVPLVFAAAGRVGPHPGRSIAGVSSVAYGAGLVAPGIIGGVASASSLRVSFCLVAGLVMIMGLSSRALAPAGSS